MYNHFPNWFFNLNNSDKVIDFLPTDAMEVQDNLDYIFRENKIEKRNDFDSKLLVFNPKYIKIKLETFDILKADKFNFVKYSLSTNNGNWKLLSITKKQEFSLRERYVGPRGLFEQYVAILLLRYKFLGGLNNHLSIPPSIYKTLDVSVELFGSPLNVAMPRYCSPFPDIEKYFGSLGKFNNISLTSNTNYAANPPYDVTLVCKMAEWINSEMKRPDLKNVTIYIVLPLWKKDFPGYDMLISSKWFRDKSELGREDYPFLHYFRSRLIPASDTYLIILSSNKKLKYTCKEIKNIWPQTRQHYIPNAKIDSDNEYSTDDENN